MTFNGKIVAVTGGAKGIGRCIAETFADHGASVALFDKDALSGQTFVERFGKHHLFVSGDAACPADLERLSQAVLSKYGAIDILVNNACLSNRGLLSRCSYEDFNEVLHVGVTAPYYLSLLFTKHFRPGASIVNIASTRAFMSQRDTESYTAAKGGITALTHALAMSLTGIARVNSVAPGWIDTSAWQGASADTPLASSLADQLQHPSQRIGQPQDIARAVLFLCSAEAGFINGENLTVDGGMTRRMIYHGDEGWAFTP